MWWFFFSIFLFRLIFRKLKSRKMDSIDEARFNVQDYVNEHSTKGPTCPPCNLWVNYFNGRSTPFPIYTKSFYHFWSYTSKEILKWCSTLWTLFFFTLCISFCGKFQCLIVNYAKYSASVYKRVKYSPKKKHKTNQLTSFDGNFISQTCSYTHKLKHTQIQIWMESKRKRKWKNERNN